MNSSQQEYCVTSSGDILLAGDSWKPNACSSCTCNNGTIQCFSQRCPAANCRVPVLRKGQCCPQCIGEYLSASQYIGWSRLRRRSFEYFYCNKKKHTFEFMLSKYGLYCTTTFHFFNQQHDLNTTQHVPVKKKKRCHSYCFMSERGSNWENAGFQTTCMHMCLFIRPRHSGATWANTAIHNNIPCNVHTRSTRSENIPEHPHIHTCFLSPVELAHSGTEKQSSLSAFPIEENLSLGPLFTLICSLFVVHPVENNTYTLYVIPF